MADGLTLSEVPDVRKLVLALDRWLEHFTVHLEG